MSLESWMREFYPIEANQGDIMSELEATEASLLKWTGLLPDNLAKHGVELDIYGDVRQNVPVNAKEVYRLWIDGSSCHLCRMSESKMHNLSDDFCRNCPILRYNGGNSCCAVFTYYKRNTKDPSEMIELLTKTRDHLKQEQQEQEQTKKD